MIPTTIFFSTFLVAFFCTLMDADADADADDDADDDDDDDDDDDAFLA